MKRKSIMRPLSICAVLIFVILTSGCAATRRMYTGEASPKEQVAVMGAVSKFKFNYNVFVWICSLDEELQNLLALEKLKLCLGFIR